MRLLLQAVATSRNGEPVLPFAVGEATMVGVHAAAAQLALTPLA
jgi:hypothetical protein